MLRKMYLLSSDYLNEKPLTKAAMHDKKTKRSRREKQTQHPYDKWVNMRRHMEDEDIERKALIQKIGDFLQKVLPSSTTYAGQTMAAPDTQADVFKSEAAPDTASPSVTPFLSRAHESVFASPIKRSLSMDSNDEGASSYVPGESTVRAFSAEHFGAVASPYVSVYVYRTGNVDKVFGMRRDADGTFRIGNADVEIDHDSNVIVQGKSYQGTRGLFELLTRKKVDQSFITDRDLKSYKEILQATHRHIEDNDPSGVIKTTRGPKFKDVICKLFPTGGVTRRSAQSTLGPKWDPY
jgi:hypothetical protein